MRITLYVHFMRQIMVVVIQIHVVILQNQVVILQIKVAILVIDSVHYIRFSLKGCYIHVI